MTRQRLILGVSGSSAPQLGWALLRALHQHPDIETHLVVSRAAEQTIRLEMDATREDFEALADVAYQPEDLGAAISSGSFRTMGMIIAPCSMKTLAAIASGVNTDLLSRAADVCLKERRRLVLGTRETPLNLIHLRNMEIVTLAGAVVAPPMPAFYHRPDSIEDLLAQSVGKMLDHFDIAHELFTRWAS
jgi:polyprenyl P-hydroxybenzoate/phenylacrylic acid decarboxylase-like protein